METLYSWWRNSKVDKQGKYKEAIYQFHHGQMGDK